MLLEKYKHILDKAEELNNKYNEILKELEDFGLTNKFFYFKVYKYSGLASPKLHSSDLPITEYTGTIEPISYILEKFKDYFDLLPPMIITETNYATEFRLTDGNNIFYRKNGEISNVYITKLKIRNFTSFLSDIVKRDYIIKEYRSSIELIPLIQEIIVAELVYEIVNLDVDDLLVYLIITSNILGAYTKKRILLEEGVSRIEAERFEREVKLFNNEYRKSNNFLPSANNIVANIIMRNIDIRKILPPILLRNNLYYTEQEIIEVKEIVNKLKLSLKDTEPYKSYIGILQGNIQSIASDENISAIVEIQRVEGDTLREIANIRQGGRNIGVIPVSTGIPLIDNDGKIKYEVVFSDGSSVIVNEEDLYNILKRDDVIYAEPIKKERTEEQEEIIIKTIKTETRGSINAQMHKSITKPTVDLSLLLDASDPYTNIYLSISGKGTEGSITKTGSINFFSVEDITEYE